MRFAALSMAVLLLASCAARAGGGLVGSTSPGPADPSASTADGLVDIGAGLKGPAGLRATVEGTGIVSVAAVAVDAICAALGG